MTEDGPELQLRRQEVAHLVRTVLDYLPTRYEQCSGVEVSQGTERSGNCRPTGR